MMVIIHGPEVRLTGDEASDRLDAGGDDEPEAAGPQGIP